MDTITLWEICFSMKEEIIKSAKNTYFFTRIHECKKRTNNCNNII